MKVFVCIDDHGGTLFMGKRQSRDRILIDDARATAGEGRLLIHPFSESLFAKEGGYHLSDNPLAEAEGSDFCFVENLPIAPMVDKIDTLYVYKWNRSYPATAHLDLDPLKSGFRLTEVTDFVGSSHEKITKETYVK